MTKIKHWIRNCAGFAWCGVNFLPSGCYGVLLWNCDEHKSWKFRNVFAAAEQGLHRVKAFFTSLSGGTKSSKIIGLNKSL